MKLFKNRATILTWETSLFIMSPQNRQGQVSAPEVSFQGNGVKMFSRDGSNLFTLTSFKDNMQKTKAKEKKKKTKQREVRLSFYCLRDDKGQNAR